MKVILLAFILVSFVLFGCTPSSNYHDYAHNQAEDVKNYGKYLVIDFKSTDSGASSSFNYLDILVICEDGVVCYDYDAANGGMGCLRYQDLADKYCKNFMGGNQSG